MAGHSRHRPKSTPDSGSLPLWVSPDREYRDCKLALTVTGRPEAFYAGLSVRERANGEYLNETGADVWICTSRPYLRLDIDPDTREWLARNKIHYDAVIWESLPDGDRDCGKFHDLVEQVGLDRIVAAVDDLPEHTADAERLGIHNIHVRDHPITGTIRAVAGSHPEVLWRLLEVDIRRKEEHGLNVYSHELTAASWSLVSLDG